MVMLDSLNQPLDYGSVHFERSNLEVTSVDVGDETVNIIPAKAVARFNVRFNDAHTLDSIKTLISERLQRTAQGGRYDLDFLPGASASFVAESGPFVDLVASAVAEETGVRPKLSTGGGTSDARFIKDHCPVVELGLVNATMHQVDERVPVADLEAVTRIYEHVIARYFAFMAPRAAVPPIDMQSDLEALLEAELGASPAAVGEQPPQGVPEGEPPAEEFAAEEATPEAGIRDDALEEAAEGEAVEGESANGPPPEPAEPGSPDETPGADSEPQSDEKKHEAQ
jgi:hypothetical protein